MGFKKYPKLEPPGDTYNSSFVKTELRFPYQTELAISSFYG